jgi:hypothetical protein
MIILFIEFLRRERISKSNWARVKSDFVEVGGPYKSGKVGFLPCPALPAIP